MPHSVRHSVATSATTTTESLRSPLISNTHHPNALHYRIESMATEKLQTYAQKPRVFILSDISNEPDDAESLCRYLLYANEFETEGLVACTSTWMRNKVCPQDMEKIIDAYAGAVDNLNKHAHPEWQYPTPEHLRGLIRKGAEVSSYSLQMSVITRGHC